MALPALESYCNQGITPERENRITLERRGGWGERERGRGGDEEGGASNAAASGGHWGICSAAMMSLQETVLNEFCVSSREVMHSAHIHCLKTGVKSTFNLKHSRRNI